MVSLAIERLTVRLGTQLALDDVSATIEGGIVGVIGPNGAGKSTLLRAIAGLVVPTQGRIRTHEERGVNKRPALAYLPQGQTVHWPVSVERLVGLGRLPHLAPLSRIGAADRAAIERALRRTDLVALRDRPVTALSGGERARALLARALAVEAPLLLADEPLAALDPRHQLELQAILRDEATRDATILIVLHDLTTAARLCDRLLLLDGGRLVADGVPDAVLTSQNLDSAYGIRAAFLSESGRSIIQPVALSRMAP